MNRLIAIILSLMLLSIMLPINAIAAGGEMSIMYAHTSKVTAVISISSGTATCTGSARATSSSNVVSLTMTLQKKVGSSWTKVTSWPAEVKGYAGLSKTKAVTKGYQYRVLVSGNIKDGDGKNLEPFSETSTIYTY